MSRFLRFIVRLLLILLVAAGAALLVPPLVGIDTVVVDDDTSSNVKRGSVVYARAVDAAEIAEGDRILRVTEDNSVNVYSVRKYDGSSKEITAVKSEGAAEEVLQAPDTVRRILLAVPYLGFLSIATQSLTGLLILGGFILIIIILFVISEVLRRGSEEDEEDYGGSQSDDDYFSSLHSKKAEKFEAEKKREEKAKKDNFPVDGEGEAFIKNLKGAISGNDLSATGSLSGMAAASAGSTETEDAPKAAPDEDDAIQTDGLPDVQAALEAALEGRQIGYGQNTQQITAEAEAEPLKTGEIELAIPIRSKDELVDRARNAGDNPRVQKDDLTGVEFVDYSDCL